MKKVILILVLTFISFSGIGQKVYYDKTEYETALKVYNDKLDSYLNYSKKINYLKNFSNFPTVENYPKTPHDWTLFLDPYFVKEKIKCDNSSNRLHPNITPDGTIFINFYHYPNTNNIVVSTSNERIDNDPSCIYSADFFTFNDPGKSPIYRDTTLSNVRHVLYVPPVKLDLYLMPDGGKYTYEQLLHQYPSMVNKLVYDGNFKKDLTNE